MKSISIIDYGMGNIRSLYNSLKYLGYNPVFYSETNKIISNVCIPFEPEKWAISLFWDD
jgi:imidazoleglycerol phosphate synthase glutamine amidotransferase subunit HisH